MKRVIESVKEKFLLVVRCSSVTFFPKTSAVICFAIIVLLTYGLYLHKGEFTKVDLYLSLFASVTVAWFVEMGNGSDAYDQRESAISSYCVNFEKYFGNIEDFDSIPKEVDLVKALWEKFPEMLREIQILREKRNLLTEAENVYIDFVIEYIAEIFVVVKDILRRECDEKDRLTFFALSSMGDGLINHDVLEYVSNCGIEISSEYLDDKNSEDESLSRKLSILISRVFASLIALDLIFRKDAIVRKEIRFKFEHQKKIKDIIPTAVFAMSKLQETKLFLAEGNELMEKIKGEREASNAKR